MFAQYSAPGRHSMCVTTSTSSAFPVDRLAAACDIRVWRSSDRRDVNNHTCDTDVSLRVVRPKRLYDL